MEGIQSTLDKIQQRINTQGSEKRLSNCKRCGNGFELVDTYQKYCSPKCQKAVEAETIKREIEHQTSITIPKRFSQIKTARAPIMDKSIFCYGPVGTGKTQYIAAVVRAYVQRCQKVKWLSCPIFIMEAQSMYRNKERDPFEYITNIANLAIPVVLDDIGIEKMSDWVRQVLYMLINERYQREYITLITSNRSLKEIDELIHPGIASRIAGMCEVLEFTGKDRRI